MKRRFVCRRVALVTCLVQLVAAAAFADLPVPADLSCSQGEDCRRILVVKSGGLPVNLTGYSYRAQVRASYTDAVPLATFVVDPSQLSMGSITLVLPSAVTTQLAGKTGVWDLQQIDPSGSVSYLVRGAFKCYLSATR